MSEELHGTMPPSATPHYCQNPECGKQISPAKWKHSPKYCDPACWHHHQALRRGKCKRPGCPNYIAVHRHAYCSTACYEAATVVPRKPCARPGCPNMASHRAHATYCSAACRDACVDMAEMSKRGVAVIKAVKKETGHGPKYARRAAATSRNNRLAPPKRKMLRTDTVYGREVLFEPEGQGYRASVPGVAGIIARGKTKKAAMSEVKRMMRQAGEAKK